MIEIYTRVNQKKIRKSLKEYVTERGLHFDQRKTFSENYVPIRDGL